MDFGFPEHGRLKRVLMHSPGEEIDRIAPTSFRRFLFEDAIDAKEFRRQHGQLVEVLRSEGVNVALIRDVLEKSPHLELIRRSPNLVYARDTVTVTPSGTISMRMRNPVRRREPRIASAALERLGVPMSFEIRAPGTMEGGDLIFLDGRTLLVGIGNRTNASGLGQLRTATRQEGLDTVGAMRLPPWVIHLDGTMMVVDEDLAIVHRDSLRGPMTVFEKGKPKQRTDLLRFLRKRGLRLIEVTAYERQRRATNVITLGPRKLVGYAGHSRVRKLLVNEGVDMIEIEGSELVRGGGGPRCMTAPIERDGGS